MRKDIYKILYGKSSSWQQGFVAGVIDRSLCRW